MAGEFSSGGAKRKRGKKYLCGVPSTECCATHSKTSNGLKNAKLHSSPEDAFKCYKNYLIRDGYTQIGSREFSKNSGPIMVLTKKSKFGSMVRGGKAERFMPSGEATGGTVIC